MIRKNLLGNVGRFAAVLSICLVNLACAQSAEKSIVLKERLNLKWGPQVLSYPMEFEKGACLFEPLTVVAGNTTLPAQLTDVELWPETNFVKKGNVTFIVDTVEPWSTNNFTVRYSSGPSSIRAASDLVIKPADGSVEITTSKVGIRLAIGEKTFEPAAAAKDVPGFLQAVRDASGAWNGGSSLYGDTAVKSWSSKIVDNGPVVGSVESRYTFANGTVATFTAKVLAGGNSVLWSVNSSQDLTTQGIDLQLGKLAGVKEANIPKTWGQWGVRPKAIALTGSDKPFTSIGPDSSVPNMFGNVIGESASQLRLAAASGTELQFVSRNSAGWVDIVKPFTYGGYEQFDLDMIPNSWENWKRKLLPVSYGAEGTVSLRVNFAKGGRYWSVSNGAPAIGERLNEVKDYILEWPAKPGLEHPHLFMTKAELEVVWQKNPPTITAANAAPGNPQAFYTPPFAAYLASGMKKDVAEKTKATEMFRNMMALLADYDVMRYGIVQLAMYDALISSDVLTPEEKAIYRSQIAYFGYRNADPTMWNMERGYHSGNPNMSISYTLTLGVTACLIPDHPMAKTWADYATKWMDKWLSDDVGPNGEWLLEGGHYSQVSLTPLAMYAVAAKRAGFHDFLSDPRFKRLMLYEAKQWTPADPQRKNGRVSPSYGRGTAGDSTGMFGILAKATAQSDPEFSKVMQWMWEKSNYNETFGDQRMGGFELMYMDRSLPSQAPKWGSELFPKLGVIFRDGIGEPTENYLNILSHTNSVKNLDIWVPEIGAVAQWYALGKPVAKQFTFLVGYNERHELFRNGVALARNWGAPGDSKLPFGYYTTVSPNGFSALDRVDYVSSTFKNTKADDRDWFPDNVPAWPKVKAATKPDLQWTRQALYMKSDASSAAHYLVLRDTTSGGQPTTWQFWTLSEKLGTPEQAASADFMADKPGEKVLPARELPASNRYTAIGQFGVDVDYYIAGPTDSPRSTVRFGGKYANVPEYQDSLHLQQAGDGAYFVAIFPHSAGSDVPAFSTLGNGKIIKVAGRFGTDYVFLSDTKADVKGDQASFSGTAGAVQDRAGSVVVALSAPGTVGIRNFSLSAPMPVSARVEAAAITLTLPEDGKGGDVSVRVPGKWKVAKDQKGAKLVAKAGVLTVTVPAGVGKVKLEKG